MFDFFINAQLLHQQQQHFCVISKENCNRQLNISFEVFTHAQTYTQAREYLFKQSRESFCNEDEKKVNPNKR